VAGDPVIHRLREIVAVHGSAIKELIHEEFGDGIMSAIDFRLRLDRRADPKGDGSNSSSAGRTCPARPPEPGPVECGVRGVFTPHSPPHTESRK